jgi:hypothetical protein
MAPRARPLPAEANLRLIPTAHWQPSSGTASRGRRSFHQPLFGVDSHRGLDLVRVLSRRTGLQVKSVSCGGVCHDTFTEWLNDRTRGRAVTVELRRSPSPWRADSVAAAILDVGTADREWIAAVFRNYPLTISAGGRSGGQPTSSANRSSVVSRRRSTWLEPSRTAMTGGRGRWL